MYKNYYLDLTAVFKLPKSQQRIIDDMYRSLVIEDDTNSGRSEVAKRYFNTLFYNGYLKEIRDEKLTKILS